MTAYMGRIGDMIPLGCVSGEAVSRAPHVSYGGGPGTLAPRRVRVHGPGGRDWSLSAGARGFGASAALESLARTQHTYGGSYRFVPCDALDHNMFTPQASDDMRGWSNVTPGWRASFPDLDLTSSVIPLTIPFIIGGAGGALTSLSPRPSTLGRILAGQTGTSPEVPAVKVGTLYGFVWASGSGTLVLRVTHENASTTTTSQPFTGTTGVLVRRPVQVALPATAVSVQLEVTAGASNIYVAWPSLAHEQNPYTSGRAADQVFLEPPSRDVVGTWGKGLESLSWTVREIGVR